MTFFFINFSKQPILENGLREAKLKITASKNTSSNNRQTALKLNFPYFFLSAPIVLMNQKNFNPTGTYQSVQWSLCGWVSWGCVGEQLRFFA